MGYRRVQNNDKSIDKDASDRAAIRRAYDELARSGAPLSQRSIFWKVGGSVTARRCEALVRDMRESGELPNERVAPPRNDDADRQAIRRAHEEIVRAGGAPSQRSIHRLLGGLVSLHRVIALMQEMRAAGDVVIVRNPTGGRRPVVVPRPVPGDSYLYRRYYLINRAVDRLDDDASRIRAAARIVGLLAATSAAGHRRAKPSPGKPDAAVVRAEAARLAIRDGRRAWESVRALLGPAGSRPGL